MKKFSKILESKENILDIIGVSEKEIKEVCQDLIDDYDYSFGIKTQYISPNGHIYYKPDQASEYYPSICVELERELTDKETGKSFKKSDVRNWSGGVYYEDDANLIKTIYETIQRLESMLDSGDIKVFYSIRSINEINLRITIGAEKTSLPIDVEAIKDFIENDIERLSEFSTPNVDSGDYLVQRTMSFSNERSMEIRPKEGTFYSDVELFDDNPRCNILRRALDPKNRDIRSTSSNLIDLIDAANIIIGNIYKECKKTSNEVKVAYFDIDTDPVYIKFRDQSLIKFSFRDDDFAKGKIKVEKGLFKNKVTDVIIYKATLDIKILVEKDYGDD